MRAIKFRGKYIATKEWVYGNYIYTGENSFHVIVNA